MPDSLWSLVVVPIGFGLLAFIEPCSVGASLLFIKSVEAKPAAARIAQALLFTVVRAVAIGLLGVAAALTGARFVSYQTAGGVALGILYMTLGFTYLAGKAGWLTHRVGPRIANLSGTRSAVALGVLFALNIPGCATPLLAALLGSAAAGSTSGAAQGFLMLSLFGLALSLPLVVALLFARARRAFDWLAGLSRRVPIVIGGVLVALGVWTAYMSLSIPSPV